MNSSNKDITAYVISFNVTYADGRTNRSELLVDLLPLMITKMDQFPASSLGDGAFHAGEARERLQILRPTRAVRRRGRPPR